MKLHFLKMHGAANDFVMIDDREGRVPWQDHFLMAALACRRTGVGCEGIILIQKSNRADFRMRFLNPDGTEAVDGLKTGYIDAGGSSVVLTGTRKGRRAVVVVLGSSTSSERDAHAARLMADALGAIAW